MFVSTSAATTVQVLPLPTAICGARFRPVRLALLLPFRRLIEQLEPGGNIQRLPTESSGHDVDYVLGRDPVYVIAGRMPKAFAIALGRVTWSLLATFAMSLF